MIALLYGEAADVRSEVRDVRARHLERRRIVRAVAAEHLRLLALLEQLLRDVLRVTRLLRGEEHDVALLGTFVTNDEKSVTVFATDRRVVETPFAFRTISSRVREALRVRLLEVEQDDVLGTLA